MTTGHVGWDAVVSAGVAHPSALPGISPTRGEIYLR
ncbi:hypothetical protein AGR4B_Lc10357 [Agrobacterium tumefaciens str. CFBP 5621]|nr:hypothetical protein AGR4B_Lc10357 [Agrobacterium tumefaciens str. CFBP 5621]